MLLGAHKAKDARPLKIPLSRVSKLSGMCDLRLISIGGLKLGKSGVKGIDRGRGNNGLITS